MWCVLWSRVAQLTSRQCLGAKYDSGEDGSAEWAKDMLEFADDNFNDAGNEVRSMDMRDRQVGLFGDFCERMGHGKFVEWRTVKESGGLYKLVLVTQVRAACLKSAVPTLTRGGACCRWWRVSEWRAVRAGAISSDVGHGDGVRGEISDGPPICP